MAHPDWIGPAVEAPFWSLDGAHLNFQLKRNGSGLRDYWQVNLAEGKPSKLDDEALADLDAANPVYDSEGKRAAFVRAGDIFMRELDSGRLHQLTRTAEAESSPQFSIDGRWLSWRSGSSWQRHRFSSGLTEPLVELKAEADPAGKTPDALAAEQLRLIDTLAREKREREARLARDQALREADPSRAAAPIYLGEGIDLSAVVLSPSTQFALVISEPKGAEKGRTGKMPKYVTESGWRSCVSATSSLLWRACARYAWTRFIGIGRAIGRQSCCGRWTTRTAGLPPYRSASRS